MTIDRYYDHQHGIEYCEGRNPERLLGCIPSKVQAEYAAQRGEQSDVDRIAELAAPWDASDKPSIIKWDDAWIHKLEQDAAVFDRLRDTKTLPPWWEIAAQFGYKPAELCGSTQMTNDCTAWALRRLATILALYLKWQGYEIDIEAYNPMGLYCYASGETPREYAYVANNGRTIYKICETACNIGNFPESAIGKYNGNPQYTPLMIKSVDVAAENQTGFVYIGEKSAQELADIIILSLRACRPVIIGNIVALRDGTHQNADGVYVSDVGGTWGGGHATAAVDIKKVGDRYYPWIYNSHGSLYPAPDGSPDGGTYITQEALARYLSGSSTDVMLATYQERPRVEYYDLNVGGVCPNE